jgi:sterol desaturase/sphingolipid hydroxylase (fatty acid hydroxylase superfamily)
MIKYILLVIPTWYVYNFIEYCLHKLSHSYKYGGYIYKIHSNHHKVHYPTSDFMDKAPFKSSFLFGIPDVIIAFGPISGLITGIFYKILPFNIFSFVISEIYLLLYISDYIHSHYHIRGSWLEKYNWFLEKRKYHYIHHIKLNKNMSLSGLCNTYDILFKSSYPYINAGTVPLGGNLTPFIK